jgi:hypothetical protein
MDVSTLRLRALEGTPLEDERVRAMVLATARAIAERSGVALRRLEATPDCVTLTVELDRLGALGLVAELRNVTNAWYEGKFHSGPLWVTHDEEERWD